ncbi:hypothetical protein [Streptomyces collinus]|uniref:hypothetical protein n=1 Tax=Streptomyces collinus TaxID=42684 RepID=UPI003814BDC8
MPDHPTIDRIPLAHSVHYAVRGAPEVPNQYGPGVLAPSEITLTYRSAPDSQLGRVHAYVAGRIWVDGTETALLPGGLYGQHYFDGLDGWPEWLAEEARLHDPDAAPTDRDAVLREAADAVFALDFDELRATTQLDSHRQAWELGTIDAAERLRRMADEAQPSCGECGHPHAAHSEGDDPVSPGRCTDCPEDDAWHDYQPTVQHPKEA